MNTHHPHQRYSIQPVARQTAGPRQARRRQLLGLGLIVVGTTWLWLRLIGWVDDLPLLLGLPEAVDAIDLLQYATILPGGIDGWNDAKQ